MKTLLVKLVKAFHQPSWDSVSRKSIQKFIRTHSSQKTLRSAGK